MFCQWVATNIFASYTINAEHAGFQQREGRGMETESAFVNFLQLSKHRGTREKK